MKLKIKGVGSKFSGTYRVAKAVHRSPVAAATRLVLELGRRAHHPRPDGRRERRAGVGRLDRGRRRDQQQRPRQARPRQGQVPVLTDQESFWAPGPPALRRQGARALDAARPREQVVVAFENGDPSFPYVLGSVFNGKDTPGDELAVTGRLVRDEERPQGADRGAGGHQAPHREGQVDHRGERRARSPRPSSRRELHRARSTASGTSPPPGDDGRVQAGRDHQGALDHARGAGLAVAEGRDGAVEAQSQLQLKGAQVSVNGSAMVAISGGLINIG